MPFSFRVVGVGGFDVKINGNNQQGLSGSVISSFLNVYLIIKMILLVLLIFGIMFFLLIFNRCEASELTVRLGAGYAEASILTQSDWGNDPPAGLVAFKYTDELSNRWNWGAEGIHVSNVFSGAPFNNDPESHFNYVGLYLEYKLWSN